MWRVAYCSYRTAAAAAARKTPLTGVDRACGTARMNATTAMAAARGMRAKGGRVWRAVGSAALCGVMAHGLALCAPASPQTDGEATQQRSQLQGDQQRNRQAEDEQAAQAGDESMDRLIESIAPMAAELGYGGVLGFSAGYATKHVGKRAAAVIGLTFIALQALQHFGYINISWRKVQSDVTATFDVDGDGQLTPNDAKVAWRQLQEMLVYHLPASSGFGTGFAMGLYFA